MLCLFNFPAYIDCNVGYRIPSSQAPASPSLSIEEAGTDSPARGYVLQKCRKNLGIFLQVHVSERVLVSIVTVLVGIHCSVQVSMTLIPTIVCISRRG